MIEALLVALIVLAAFVYSAWVLLPRGWKRRWLRARTGRAYQHALNAGSACSDCGGRSRCGAER